MLLIFLHIRGLVDRIDLAVDTNSHKAFFSGLLHDILMFALASAHQRRQNLQPGALFQLHDLVHHLRGGLLGDLFTAVETVRHADARKQKPKIIIDFRHSTYSRAGIFGGCALFNRDRRRETINEIDIRLIHNAQKLTGVGR